MAELLPLNRKDELMNIKPELEHLRRGHPIQDILLILMGTFLFSASMNWIVLPHAMYSGGFLGIAQLLRMLLAFRFLEFIK